MGGVYSHNNNKLNKTKMLSEKDQKIKNSGTSTQTIDMPNLNINVRPLLPSLVYPYFELDIEQDTMCKALLIKQEN